MTPASSVGGSLEGAGLAIFLLATIPLALGVIAFLVGRILAPPRPSSVKLARYEAGNPPHGRARGWLAMQYYPYLLLFLTFEPVAVILLALGLIAADLTVSMFILLVAFTLVYLPQLFVVVAQSKDLKLWELGVRKCES